MTAYNPFASLARRLRARAASIVQKNGCDTDLSIALDIVADESTA